ncbi:MAG: RecX family transcriptional regulator [Cyclobacteriaceae bacterium]|nr:RecX family transcriptional regulator [Cyclobacteriaceae bacterium]
MTTTQAKQKLYRYCAYQERCHQEVKIKLEEFKVDPDTAEEIIGHLIKEGFLNEERFARSFASGKFRLKSWGKLKIVRELEQRNVSANCIKEGLKEITEFDYQETISALILKKANLAEEDNIFVMRDKIARYAIAKGFEPDLVWQQVKQLIPDKRQ